MLRSPSFAILLFLLLASGFTGIAQDCGCPPIESCKPCAGGYTSITLRYDGTTPAHVVIIDGQSTLANLTLNPLQRLTITGSKNNEKFADKEVPVVVDGVTDAVLDPSCSKLTVGEKYGAFTIISGISIGGDTVCCPTPPSDLVAPSITNIPSVVEAQAIDNCNAQVTWAEPIATDNCTMKAMTATHQPGEFFPIGTTTVTYTAEDVAGQITTASFNVVVKDENPPVFSGGPMDDVIVMTSSCSATADWTPPTATDNCTVKAVTSSHVPGQSFPAGSTTVSYTAEDESGLSTAFTFNVIVVNEQPLVLDGGPQQDIIVASESACSATVAWAEPTVVGKCNIRLNQSHYPNDLFPVGRTTVTYEASDPSGNTASLSFDVVVEDREAPVFNVFPENIHVTATSECSAIATWAVPQASDACGLVAVTSAHNPGDEFPAGVTLVEYIAEDISGNRAKKSFTITVTDQKPLEIRNCPDDIRLTVDEDSSTPVFWREPTAGTQCGEIHLKSSHRPNDLFSPGITAVEYAASAGSGRKIFCKFNVEILVAAKLIGISKLITPDGDGTNDEWILANINQFEENKVTVFDRWGGLIFQGQNYDNERVVWEGNNRSGGQVPTGTYFYLIIAHNGNKKIEMSGSVELVR